VGSGTLAATLVLAPPLAGLLWLSGTVALPVAFGAMTLFVFVVMSAGFLLLRAAHAADMPAPAAWVLGIFATAIAVYAMVASFQLLGRLRLCDLGGLACWASASSFASGRLARGACAENELLGLFAVRPPRR